MRVKSNRQQLLITSEKLSPVTQVPSHRAVKHPFPSRKLPLAAAHLQLYDIKCFHIVCICTLKHRAIHFFHLIYFQKWNKREKMSIKSVFSFPWMCSANIFSYYTMWTYRVVPLKRGGWVTDIWIHFASSEKANSTFCPIASWCWGPTVAHVLHRLQSLGG